MKNYKTHEYSTSKNATQDEVMICPYCGSENPYVISTDEIEFGYNNKGHYYFDCCCDECKEHFRVYMQFEYKVTKAYTKIKE